MIMFSDYSEKELPCKDTVASRNLEPSLHSLKASFSRWRIRQFGVFKSHLSKFCKLFPVDAQIHLSQISERAIASRARDVKSPGKYCHIRGFASGGEDFYDGRS